MKPAPTRFRRALASAMCLLAFAASPSRAAIQSPGPANLSLEVIEKLRTDGVPDDKWPLLMETMGNGENTAAVRSLVKDLKPFPAAKLIDLLSSRRLAVRLGALDLLEDAAGDTFGFDAWQEDPAAGPNADALARWKTWAAQGRAAATTLPPLTEETFRVIAEEIVSGNRERSERAMQRIERHGLAAIAHIEAFLASRTDIAPASRAALKAAEYRVTLMQSVPKRAAALARDLAQGGAEAQSVALAALSHAGATALPVVADFLASPDALVRETAVDTAFATGGKHAIPLILARLEEPKPAGLLESLTSRWKQGGSQAKPDRETEKTNSVLHAMLRGLGKLGSEDIHARTIALYMEHPDENVVISATEALAVCLQGDLEAALSARLDDPRWRIRAAALETIGKRKLSGLKDRVVRCLEDSDLFVRTTAVAAITMIAQREAAQLLTAEFAKKDDLKPGILKAFFASRTKPGPPVWEALKKAPPEIILQCLDLLDDRRDDHEGKRIPYAAPFARHPNKDVSAAALRLLASRGRSSALLLDALNSGDPAKQDAVLDQLHLPIGSLRTAPAGVAASSADAPGAATNPKLDALYSAFKQLSPAKPAAPPASPAPSPDDDGDRGPADAPEQDAPAAQLRATLERYFKNGSPRQRFVSAVSLAMEGSEEAARFLGSNIEVMSGLDRRYVAGALRAMPEWPEPAQDLARRLLRDPADDVREEMLDGWKEHPDRIPALLAEMSRPGSPITPDGIFDYQLDRILKSGHQPAEIAKWADDTLASAKAPDSHRIAATILLARMGKSRPEVLTQMLGSPNHWMRRAAWRALGLGNAATHLDKLLADESAHVRAVLPFLASPHDGGWRHIFDDAHDADDYESGERRYGAAPFGAWAGRAATRGNVTPEVIAALGKLARDPSDRVRFEAMFALLRLSRPVDPDALTALLVTQPEDSRAKSRIEQFLVQNHQRLGKAYGVLVPVAFEHDSENLAKVMRHFGIGRDGAFTSFAALASLAPKPNHAADTAIAPPPAEPSDAHAQEFRVVFFHKPGCRECDRVRDMLRDAARDFPRMLVEERDIGERSSALLNEVLAARFGLADANREVTPSVCVQSGALVKSDITVARLHALLSEAAKAAPDPGWANVTVTETEAAHRTVEERFSSLGVWVVLGAGLLDGINPCAFATIIFLLSYLQVARRSRREILAVGASYIAGVFLAYFAIGLGMARAISAISAFRIAGSILNYILAASAIVVAVLSFRDAQLAARGELGEMTLQLPDALKTRIRGVIRAGSKSTRYIIAAFAVGLVISFLELACTGQVYLPTIQYMLMAGRSGAVAHLLLYNIAFITPLITVFLLAFFGLSSEALIAFQRRRTSTVKVLTGLLFVLLAAFLLFGHRLFGV